MILRAGTVEVGGDSEVVLIGLAAATVGALDEAGVDEELLGLGEHVVGEAGTRLEAAIAGAAAVAGAAVGVQ